MAVITIERGLRNMQTRVRYENKAYFGAVCWEARTQPFLGGGAGPDVGDGEEQQSKAAHVLETRGGLHRHLSSCIPLNKGEVITRGVPHPSSQSAKPPPPPTCVILRKHGVQSDFGELHPPLNSP